MIEIIIQRFIFTIKLPDKGDTFLWYVDDGRFRYYHFVQWGVVSKNDGFTAVQLIIGPVMFTLAWLLENEELEAQP